MGLYIEAEDKLGWLKENGTLTTQRGVVKDDEFLVCWVDNGMFQAVGVAFDERELEAFTQPSDTRDKLWFIVKKSELEKVCPQWDSYVGKDK